MEELLPLPTSDELSKMIAETCYHYPHLGGLQINIDSALAMDLDELTRYAKHQADIRREIIQAYRRRKRSTT